jgi:L-2,4-diaminobutyric acid acetyltransferase
VPADNLSIATHTIHSTAVTFRTVALEDARQIAKLVSESDVLDSNSLYCYLLLCRDFSDTCLVACRGQTIVGFVTAYRPPPRPDHLFVWQIGTAESVRRQGLGRRLLRALISLSACQGVRFLEATVTPSNAASRGLFESFARELAVPCCVTQGLTTEMFGDGDHEPEDLFRLGPLPAASQEYQNA